MSNIFLQAIMHQACQLPTDPSQLAFTICREILVFVLNYKHFLTKPTAAEIVSVFFSSLCLFLLVLRELGSLC